MMIKLIKAAIVAIGIFGFFLMLGAVGSDCDGKCMENAMSLLNTLLYSLLGVAIMVGALIGFNYMSNFE